MAETKDGRKFIRIKGYTYEREDGTTVKVPGHDRSTPHTSTGKASGSGKKKK